MTHRLTIQDCRDCGYCLSGVRRHCDTLGLDFRALVRDGLPMADLEGRDDQLLNNCLDKARQRIEAQEASDG